MDESGAPDRFFSPVHWPRERDESRFFYPLSLFRFASLLLCGAGLSLFHLPSRCFWWQWRRSSLARLAPIRRRAPLSSGVVASFFSSSETRGEDDIRDDRQVGTEATNAPTQLLFLLLMR